MMCKFLKKPNHVDIVHCRSCNVDFSMSDEDARIPFFFLAERISNVAPNRGRGDSPKWSDYVLYDVILVNVLHVVGFRESIPLVKVWRWMHPSSGLVFGDGLFEGARLFGDKFRKTGSRCSYEFLNWMFVHHHSCWCGNVPYARECNNDAEYNHQKVPQRDSVDTD